MRGHEPDGITGIVVRPRLLDRLDEVLTHRLTTITADAGFGKTVLLEQWLPQVLLPVVRPVGRDLSSVAGSLVRAVGQFSAEEGQRLRLVVGSGTAAGSDDRPGALAGVVCASLSSVPKLELVLVLDDAQGLHPGALRFLERLCRQAPPSLHLLVASRTELPFSTDRMQDEVLALTGTDLGFTEQELTDVLQAVLGDTEHAEAVRRLTGGWPAAVRLAAAALARHPHGDRAAELARMTQHGGAVLAEFASQVVSTESPAMRRLSQLVAPYDGFTAELAEHLGCEGAADTIADLASRGIVVRLGFDRFQYYAFPRLLRDFIRVNVPMTEQERPALVRQAAAWFEEHGQIEGALRCAIDQQDSPWIAQMLRRHGLSLVSSSRGARVAAALACVSPEDLDADLLAVTGAVLEGQSRPKAALEAYQSAAAGQDVRSRVVGLAYRLLALPGRRSGASARG